MTATEASPVEIVLSLAREAIEKREHADEDCKDEWAAYHKARRQFAEPKSVKAGKAHITVTVDALNGQKAALHDYPISDAMIATVLSRPGEEHLVGTFESGSSAYKHRLRWTSAGYMARTQRIVGTGIGVYALARASR